MIRKIILVALLFSAICVTTYMFSYTTSSNKYTIEADLKLKKVHQQKATAKGDWGWEKRKPKGIYSSTNSHCINRCTAAGGENCGSSEIVCCHPEFCFSNVECIEELFIPGCDS